MTEWIVIIVGCIQFIFFIGMYFQKAQAKGAKVENHDVKLSDFEEKFDKVAAKVNLIENESTSHKENIHRMRNDLNSFIALTNQRFEKSEKNQGVQLMLMSQICEKLGVNTEMAKFLMVD
jgi:hypothetical protein